MDPQLFPKKKKKYQQCNRWAMLLFANIHFWDVSHGDIWKFGSVSLTIIFFINLSVSEAKSLPKHFVILLASLARSLSHLTHSHLPPCITSAIFYPLSSSCLTSHPTLWLLGKASGCLSASAPDILVP